MSFLKFVVWESAGRHLPSAVGKNCSWQEIIDARKNWKMKNSDCLLYGSLLLTSKYWMNENGLNGWQIWTDCEIISNVVGSCRQTLMKFTNCWRMKVASWNKHEHNPSVSHSSCWHFPICYRLLFNNFSAKLIFETLDYCLTRYILLLF